MEDANVGLNIDRQPDGKTVPRKCRTFASDVLLFISTKDERTSNGLDFVCPWVPGELCFNRCCGACDGRKDCSKEVGRSAQALAATPVIRSLLLLLACSPPRRFLLRGTITFRL